MLHRSKRVVMIVIMVRCLFHLWWWWCQLWHDPVLCNTHTTTTTPTRRKSVTCNMKEKTRCGFDWTIISYTFILLLLYWLFWNLLDRSVCVSIGTTRNEPHHSDHTHPHRQDHLLWIIGHEDRNDHDTRFTSGMSEYGTGSKSDARETCQGRSLCRNEWCPQGQGKLRQGTRNTSSDSTTIDHRSDDWTTTIQ